MEFLDKFFLGIEGLDDSLLGKLLLNQLGLNPSSLRLFLKEMVGSLGNKA